jgi:hypothetical protein
VALELDNAYVTYLNWDCYDSGILAAESAGRAAAIARAGDNDYTIDEDVSDMHGVETICGEDTNIGWVDKYIDVHTMITRDTNTSFAHLIYSGPLRNTVDAVTRVRPRTPFAMGNAIVATRDDCPNTDTGGVHIDGNSNIRVSGGGGVFSNACVVAGGSVDAGVTGGGEITCIEDDCYTENGSPDVSPEPQEGNAALPQFAMSIPTPNCSGMTDYGSHSGSGTIHPGQYDQIRLNSASSELKMQPGLYCLDGDFVANGGIITGTHVTIYIENGDFDISGGVQITLTAPPNTGCAVCPPAIEGMLIYLAEGNDGEVSLLGNSESKYLGTVYAPSGTIEAGGTGSEISEINAQLIADTVKLHGTTDMIINYDPDDGKQVPPLIELYK